MVVELGAREPGFTKKLLYVPNTAATDEITGPLAGIFSGTPSPYNAVPINGYWFEGDKLLAAHYIDEGLQDTLSCPIAYMVGADHRSLPIQQQQEYIEQELVKETTFYL